MRPIHSLYVQCNQLHWDRVVTLTGKQRGHLSQWETKIQDAGLEHFEVLDHVIQEWDVFGSIARADERVGYKVPNRPDPESLIECIDASIDLWLEKEDS